MQQKAGIYFSSHTDLLSITESTFEDVQVGTSNSIILADEVSTVIFQNCSFTNIDKSSSTDESMTMVNFASFDLTHSEDSVISDIVIESSTISFLEFTSLTGSLSNSIVMSISSITFSNMDLDLSLSLISFGNMESEEEISFTFSNLKFSNITFGIQGELLSFEHQLTSDIIVENSVFENIVSGEIYIESANKQNKALSSRVYFLNNTFSNIYSSYGSLMVVNEGGYVTIDSCSFSNISTLEEGAVIYAGYQKANVIIYSSNFTYNYAVTGGVFYSESESVIKIYDSRVTNNFAITSAVFHASNNGYFEMYNTLLTNNYAISNSISQIFDVATMAIIDQ